MLFRSKIQIVPRRGNSGPEREGSCLRPQQVHQQNLSQHHLSCVSEAKPVPLDKHWLILLECGCRDAGGAGRRGCRQGLPVLRPCSAQRLYYLSSQRNLGGAKTWRCGCPDLRGVSWQQWAVERPLPRWQSTFNGAGSALLVWGHMTTVGRLPWAPPAPTAFSQALRTGEQRGCRRPLENHAPQIPASSGSG